MSTCRKCGMFYEPDTWNFYSLCNPCFKDYNKWRTELPMEKRPLSYMSTTYEKWLEYLENPID